MAWQHNQGSPVSGVLLHEYDGRDTVLTNHIDKTSLLPFAALNQTTHLGTRDIYAFAHQSEVPFAIPNIKAGNVELLNDNTYSFDMPQATESDTTIVSVSTNDIVAGELFELVASNGRLGSFGARISPNVTRPYAFEAVDFTTMPGSNKVKYTLIYRGNVKGENKVPGDVLVAGGSLFKLGGVRSREFGQDFDSWQTTGGPNRKYISKISDYELQTHYHMTLEGCNFFEEVPVKDKQWVLDNLYKVVDYVGIKNPFDPSITSFQQYLEKGGSSAPSALGFKLMTMVYDKISIGILKKQEQNMMVWDPGGYTGGDGHDKQYIHPGVWHQYEYSGYKHGFNPFTATKDMLLAAIREYEAGKKIQPIIGQPRVYEIRTGDGGLRILQNWFREEYNAQVGALQLARDLKQYEGDNKTGIDVNSGYFTSITVDMQRYKLTWKLDPSLNPTKSYAVENPVVGGYRLSSYAMIIEDANFSSSNIKLLRNKHINGGGMRMMVVNGSMSHPMYTATNQGIPIHQGASLATGFGAYFFARPDTAVVWDPTQALRLIPINPLTGRWAF